MDVRIECVKTVVPNYNEGISPPTTFGFVPLSVFDKFTYDYYDALLIAYQPPTPPNASIEYGLKRALSEYRVLAGRLGEDEKGNDVFILNDKGVKLVEASVDSKLDNVMPVEPSPDLCCLCPSTDNVEELLLVQLTRFTCGSLVIGFTSHHMVADGQSVFNFLVAWAKASRGIYVHPLPLHDRSIFKSRNPPQFEFEHRGVSFVRKLINDCPQVDNSLQGDIICHKVNFTVDFLAKIKAAASPTTTDDNKKKPTTYEALTAHLWRAITKARDGLNGSETSHVLVSVNGRTRMIPRVPNEYFGNLVLWAFPSGRINDILKEPLSYTAKLVQGAVACFHDSYFKSFIDFATHKAEKEDIYPVGDKSSYSPNLDVNSWLRFPILEVDFGGGSPYLILPPYFPTEGMIYLLPSLRRNGSIDVFVFLFKDNLAKFRKIVYSLDQRSCL